MTIEGLIKAKEDVLNKTHRIAGAGGDVALSGLVVDLVDYVITTRQMVDANIASTEALENQVGSQVGVHRDILECIKMVLERQQEGITNLTLQTTMLEGVALQVGGHVTPED